MFRDEAYKEGITSLIIFLALLFLFPAGVIYYFRKLLERIFGYIYVYEDRVFMKGIIGKKEICYSAIYNWKIDISGSTASADPMSGSISGGTYTEKLRIKAIDITGKQISMALRVDKYDCGWIMTQLAHYTFYGRWCTNFNSPDFQQFLNPSVYRWLREQQLSQYFRR